MIKLSNDKDDLVRIGVVSNPSTPKDVLLKFWRVDTCLEVKFGVRKHPALADDEFIKTAMLGEWWTDRDR